MSATIAAPPSSTSGQENIDLHNASVLAGLMDHTLLRPEPTMAEVTAFCEAALTHNFHTVFVHPVWVPLAAAVVRGSAVRVGTPVGFPYGTALASVKRAEAEAALRVGAHELDMVLNVGALRSKERKLVELDIRGVVETGHEGGALVKVILETGLLTMEEKILACELALNAGADFVKTSTGLHGGATADDVALMRGVVGTRAGVKASGGIRTLAAVTEMVHAGANRIGTSSAVAILQELQVHH